VGGRERGTALKIGRSEAKNKQKQNEAPHKTRKKMERDQSLMKREKEKSNKKSTR
jgi:hypothetical protein